MHHSAHKCDNVQSNYLIIEQGLMQQVPLPFQVVHRCHRRGNVLHNRYCLPPTVHARILFVANVVKVLIARAGCLSNWNKIGCGLYKCCHRRGMSWIVSVLQLSCATTTAAASVQVDWWSQIISFFFPEAQRTYQRHKSGLSWCTLSLYSSQKSKYN